MYIRRIIQIATHQCFDGEWRKVCWIDYTYNEMGLKETRKNYNDFNDYEFQKGELTYSENR